MNSSLTMLERAVPLACAALFVAGTAQAALLDRDLDGNGQVDAFYDTDLDITWLRNANVNGQMLVGEAIVWAAGYSLGTHSDWRLPTSDSCEGYNCTGSEMGHLWYVELGNLAGGPMTNTGGFQNLQSYAYWSETQYNATLYRDIDFSDGYQIYDGNPTKLYAMAVTNGDVGAVPEPETYALMLAGLPGLAFARRQRHG